MRLSAYLPRWRGRQQGRHELDPAAAAAAHKAWAAGLAVDAGTASMGLADELAARRIDAAALAIEREYLDAAELWPANRDEVMPGWAVIYQTPAGPVDEDQGDELDEAPGLGAAGPVDEDQGDEPGEVDEAPGLGAGLGARFAPPILLAARILDEAGTVEGALRLAAAAARVLDEIDRATGLGLDEDTRRLAALLDEDQAGQPDPRGDA